jgi:hypothetical protein
MEIVEMVTIPKELEEIQSYLKKLNINETTPLEALSYLNEWKKKIKE